VKRVIVTLSDDLARRLAALREYLEGRGFGAHVK
jgi:hypothetical protein